MAIIRSLASADITKRGVVRNCWQEDCSGEKEKGNKPGTAMGALKPRLERARRVSGRSGERCILLRGSEYKPLRVVISSIGVAKR